MSTPRPIKVFISRTTKGLEKTAEKVAAILTRRGCEVIHQPDFTASPRNVQGMLVDHLIDCDVAICLVGTAHGMLMREPVKGLSDPRTEDRLFSYTQLEMLVMRNLRRHVFTYIVSGDELIAPFTETPDLAKRQRDFIKEFAQDGSNVYKSFDTLAALTAEIERIPIEYSVFAGKRENLPYASLGTLFKGREDFLTELRQHLTAEAATVIKGRRTIHGMGGVGKTRAAIEYAWKHADDYSALLFVSADSPESLQRNLASLCGPLVLNLPEQSEKDQSLQVAAALKWLQLHPGWFLILDNVDTTDAAREATALLTKLSAGHIVITSRIGDWSGHVKSLDLDVLSDAAAIAFLDERTDERRIHQPDDPSQVAKLVRLLDCLALALEQAGAHISHRRLTYADYLALFEKTTPAALAWHDEKTMHYPRSLAITYETSVAQLSPGAKNLFRILSWLAPDPIPRDTINSLPNPDDETRHLSELENLHLANFLKESRAFTIHRLVQEITRGQQPNAKKTEILNRGFLGLFKKTCTLFVPPPALSSALAWLDSAFSFEPSDIRTWFTAMPLAPHAESVAVRAADRNIMEPTAALLSRCGVFHSIHLNYASAEPLLRKALALNELNYGKNHTAVAKSLHNLGTAVHQAGNHQEAGALFEQARAIYKPNDKDLGEERTRRLKNLGQLVEDPQKLAEAMPLFSRIVEQQEKMRGDGPLNIADWIKKLAQSPEESCRQNEEERQLRSDLLNLEHSLGESDPQVIATLSKLAHLLKNDRRYDEAVSAMVRIATIIKTMYGLEHPEVATALNNLGVMLHDAERLDEAEQYLRWALAINETCFGQDHPEIASSLGNLAHLLNTRCMFDEAEKLLLRAVTINEAAYGENHPAVALSLNKLARFFQSIGRLREAESPLKRALEILVTDTVNSRKEHPRLQPVMTNYIELLAKMGESEVNIVKKVSKITTKANSVVMNLHEIIAGVAQFSKI